MVGVEEPEGAGEAVGVPRGEQGGGDADQVGEDGDADGEHEGGAGGEEDERDPHGPAEHGVVVQVHGAAEKADEDDLRGGVVVQGAGDQEVGQREPPRRLGPHGGQRGEGRAGDGVADVEVHDDGEEDVEGRRECLQQPGGFLGVARVLHLGDQREEHEVPRVGEDGVGDRHEGEVEARVDGDADLAVGDRVEAGADHGDEGGDDDGDDGGDAEPREAQVERARQAEEERGDGEDAAVPHQAELVVGEGAERGLRGEQLASDGEDGEEDGAEGEDLAPPPAEDDVAGVAHVVD